MFVQTIDDMGCWKGPKRFIEYKWPLPTGLVGQTKICCVFLASKQKTDHMSELSGIEDDEGFL